MIENFHACLGDNGVGGKKFGHTADFRHGFIIKPSRGQGIFLTLTDMIVAVDGIICRSRKDVNGKN